MSEGKTRMPTKEEIDELIEKIRKVGEETKRQNIKADDILKVFKKYEVPNYEIPKHEVFKAPKEPSLFERVEDLEDRVKKLEIWSLSVEDRMKRIKK